MGREVNGHLKAASSTVTRHSQTLDLPYDEHPTIREAFLTKPWLLRVQTTKQQVPQRSHSCPETELQSCVGAEMRDKQRVASWTPTEQPDGILKHPHLLWGDQPSMRNFRG